MKEISVKELKDIQLDILDQVHAFCQAHNLTYSLCYGTLIGAVRHKGYIPWDDDIDICMPRADYECFIKSFDGAKGNLKVWSYATDSSYYLPFAKVGNTQTSLLENVRYPLDYGVNIDVYPCDRVPESVKSRCRLFRRIKLIKQLATLKNLTIDKRRNFLKNLLVVAGHGITFFISLRKLMIQEDYLRHKYTSSTSGVCNIVAASCVQISFSRKAIEKTIDVEFEGRVYKMMAGYDEFLTKIFGDYMTPPPEKERVTHHDFKAYWK